MVTPPCHTAPHRLPWNANPWRARLARGSWLTRQALRSHEARVTLEDSLGGVSAGSATRCPICHPQTLQVPSGPWVPPRRSLQAGPARGEMGCEGSWGRTPSPGGCPGGTQGVPRGCPGATNTTHITTRPPWLALQAPIALLTLLALQDRHMSPIVPPVLSPKLLRLMLAGPGTSATIPGVMSPHRWAGLTFCPSVPAGPGSPCTGKKGQVGAQVGSCR